MLLQKKRRCAGETLTETLAAIVVVVLSGILFLQMAVASDRILGTVLAADTGSGKQLEAVEAQDGRGEADTCTGTVSVDGRSYGVTFYSAGDLTAYAPENST